MQAAVATAVLIFHGSNDSRLRIEKICKKEHDMRGKRFLLLICLLYALSIVSCSKKEVQEGTPSVEEDEPSEGTGEILNEEEFGFE